MDRATTRKVFKLVTVTNGEQSRPKAIAAYNLSSELFQFNSSGCELTTECGALIEDDDTLQLLREDSKSLFFIQNKVTDLQECHHLDIESNPQTIDVQLVEENDPLNVEMITDPPHFENTNILKKENEKTVDLLVNVRKAEKSPSESSESCESSESLYFPVFKILAEMRDGIKGDKAEDIIFRLKNSSLGFDSHDRNLLKNAVGTWLLTNCSDSRKTHYPSPREYLKMAKSIVHFFPCLRNSSSAKPWDLFYDEDTRLGELESYCRSKRSRKLWTDKRRKTERKCSSFSAPESLPSQEILEAEAFMREMQVTDDNCDEHLLKFTQTRHSRRLFIKAESHSATDILNRYPRLKDMERAVFDEFNFLTNSSLSRFLDSWASVELNILGQAELCLRSEGATALVKSANLAKVTFDSDKVTECAFQLLPHLLKCRSICKKNEGLAIGRFDLIFRSFDETWTANAAIAECPDVKQPGILRIGGRFYVKIDHVPVQLPGHVRRLQEAVGYLVMYYFVLSLEYPILLQSVFVFFEYLFGIEPTKSLRVAKRLYAKVAHRG